MTDYFTGYLHSDAAANDSIALKRAYIDMCDGNLYDAVMLSQIVYWHTPNKKRESRLKVFRDGFYWLAKRYEDWHEECRIDTATARKCIDRLIKRGLLIKKIYHFEDKPTVHIRINPEGFEAALRRLYDTTGQITPNRPDVAHANDTSGQMEVIRGSSSYNESSTETTTETTAVLAAQPATLEVHPAPMPETPDHMTPAQLRGMGMGALLQPAESARVKVIKAHPYWQAYERGWDDVEPPCPAWLAEKTEEVIAKLERRGVKAEDIEALTRLKVNDEKRTHEYRFTYLLDDLPAFWKQRNKAQKSSIEAQNAAIHEQAAKFAAEPPPSATEWMRTEVA